MDIRPRGLDYLSICTGGGGLDLAIELAAPSARGVAYVEREAFACSVLVSAFEKGYLAPAPIWSDVRTFDGRPWRGLVDGIIGGIPCQPHSLAGRKLGQQDGRDLWSDARRIVATARPWFVLIENVSGMLSAGADEVAGAERVWRDLRKLGYSVEGGLFTAAEVGASHERERVFILGVADARGQRSALGISAAFEREGPAVAQYDSDAMAYTELERPEGRSINPGDHSAGRLNTEPGDRRDAGIPGRKTLGNAESLGRSNISDGAGEAGQHVIAVDRPASGNSSRGDTSGNLSGEPKDTGSAWVRSIFPPSPRDVAGWRTVIERDPQLEPAFRRVADGLASQLDVARVDRLRLLGNGVVPLEGAYSFRVLAKRLADQGYDQLWKLCL